MKIPKKAKKVFDGIIFDVYHWEQEMYDGSKATFEALKRPDTVRIIAVQDDKILLNHEQQPGLEISYGTFGGRVDDGENKLMAAKRELLEETGLESDDWELLDVYEPYYHKMDFKVHLYVARNCKKISEQNLDSGEKIEIKPVSFDEFIKIVVDKNFDGKETKIEILKLLYKNKIDKFKSKLFKS